MILVDTSVWIEVFRRGGLKLQSFVDLDDVVTCLPVVQEVLQGFRHQRAFNLASQAMLNLPIVESPVASDVYLEAVNLYRSARQNGVTLRSPVDCLIGACALRNDLEVLHKERDFTALARVSGLRQRSL